MLGMEIQGLDDGWLSCNKCNSNMCTTNLFGLQYIVLVCAARQLYGCATAVMGNRNYIATKDLLQV